MNNLAKNYIKIFLAVTFWASFYQIAPLPLQYVDIYLFGFLRYLFASLIFIFVHYFYTKTFLPKLNLEQWCYILAISFFGVFLYNITFLWAEKLISGNIVAIIYAFSPCLIIILSSCVFKIKINLQAKLGILIALLGTIGATLKIDTECLADITINLGQILSILAVLCFSAYTIFSKGCARKGISMVTINTYSAIVGMIMFAIVSIFKSDFTKLNHTDLSFWLSMFYISIFVTVISYLWYLQSLEEIGIYKTAVFQNMLPFLVILIGFLFYGETISVLTLIFGGVVFSGVYMTNVAVNKKVK